MVLRGQSSGAIATIDDVRLLSDIGAFVVVLSLFLILIILVIPRFETGTKIFTLTNDPENNLWTAIAEDETFTASGTLENVQEMQVSVRDAFRSVYWTIQQFQVEMYRASRSDIAMGKRRRLEKRRTKLESSVPKQEKEQDQAIIEQMVTLCTIILS